MSIEDETPKAEHCKPMVAITVAVMLPVYFVVGMVLWPANNYAPELQQFVVNTVLSGAFGAAVGYWFGSSTDSARKTEIIAQTGPVPK